MLLPFLLFVQAFQGFTSEICITESASGRNEVEYDPSTRVCCGGQLSVRPPDEDIACCGTHAINGRTTLCCDDNIHPLLPGTICCGKEAISIITQACHNGQVKEKSELKPEELTKSFCQNQEYDKATELCCDGVLHQYEFERECCGNQTYDTETEECTGNIVNKRNICGAQVFQPANHICCQGKLFPKNKNRLCCGQEIYDPRVQVCINGVKRHKFYQFCGSIRYDRRTHSCCGITVHKIDNMSACCNGILIDNQTDLCCDGLIYPKLSGMHCCGPRTYNDMDSICIDGIVKSLNPIPEMYSFCCGDVIMDSRKQVCCSSKDDMFEYPINKFREDQDQCCIGVPYNSMTDICTDTGLQSRNGMCNNVTYDKVTDLCCEDTLYSGAKERGLICCPAKSKFATNQVCCENSEKKQRTSFRRLEVSKGANTTLPEQREKDAQLLPFLTCPSPCSWSNISYVKSKYGCNMQAIVVKKSSMKKGEAAMKGVFNMRTDLLDSPDSWQNMQTAWKLKNTCKCFFRRKTLIFVSRNKALSEFDVVENTHINRDSLIDFKSTC